MKKYLHMAIIFKASNLNYGEGIGNILSLKKISTEGKLYSYISRQAIRYDIVRMLEEMYAFKKATTVNIGTKKNIMVQFAPNASIKEFPEIDFFGYMKTEKKTSKGKAGESDGEDTVEKTKIRKAVVRLTDAISLEPFNNEMDFGTNKGLADRIEDLNGNNIFQPEVHRSYYCYNLTCDLDEIGVDKDIQLEKAEKAERIKALLNVLKLLYRDIRGKRENLAPLFIIGGLYDCGNPFFYNMIKINFKKEGNELDINSLNDILMITMPPHNKTVESQTIFGCVNGEFINVQEIKRSESSSILSIENFFTNLINSIDQYYK
jgi:CRISPR-associated protein Cst2